MKILLDHSSPFLLAHGGFQIQIERTKAALEEIGIEVEFLSWWNSAQKGDLIHHFSPASCSYLQLANNIGCPVVMTSLLSETCNRSDLRLKVQGQIVRAILTMPMGEGVKNQLQWRSFSKCSQNVVGLQAERTVLETVYGIPKDRISVIPLGLSETYLRAGSGTKSEAHLICTGTITKVKNTVLLARMARAAKVPILFVGKPYHPSDPYWLEFKELIDNQFVIYKSHVEHEHEMIALLHSARGFVLFSDYENWCLSAHEATACGLPLLLPDRKWSRERFGDSVSYFHRHDIHVSTENLRKFHEDAVRLSAPKIKLYSWKEVAQQLKNVYEGVLSTSL